MHPKTTVVTVTYGNRLRYLEQLITRTLAERSVHQVIVVSNAATVPLDGLEARWPGQVKVIALSENTGSANGYAEALDAALASDTSHIWMMDDDNAPLGDALNILHRQLDQLGRQYGNDKVAVLGYRPTQQADIAQCIPTRMITQPRSSYFGFHVARIPYKIWRRTPWGRPRGGAPAALVELPFAPYGGMLAHRSLYERIGLPLRELVLYSDDTEYTYRITQGGGKLFMVTGAELEELEHSWNIKENTSNVYQNYLKAGSDFRAYYAARNQAWFDKNVWASSRPMYRLNRYVFHTLLKLFARDDQSRQRLALIRRAVADGETGALGINRSYPL
ncbi:glycosyltransferase [Pseudomonas sp. EpS/L25]|uniref:glycosyltransferase n=1 Tax=Pseudomonas sp. EpS/L25 TaxID=1749078 RepID=UPI0007433CC9|nr:glycosyltransferase [Pseudomonas sp. EpS/L25]KUM39590.1 glycosyl transferase family 2 [Pseudomonas sp. EpS/L25]